MPSLMGVFIDSTSALTPTATASFLEAGHDDAGKLDRHLRRPGIRYHLWPDQPPGHRHSHQQGPVGGNSRVIQVEAGVTASISVLTRRASPSPSELGGS